MRELSVLSKTGKKILAEVYLASLGIATSNGSLQSLADRLGIEEEDARRTLSSLQDEGLVASSSDNFSLTSKGREEIKVVMTGGAFDIIHPGHLETLEKSKALGDVLVVSVARDVTFEKSKHRKPLHNEELRRKLVAALRPVDAAVLGSKNDIFEIVEFLKPDIITLGYDQSHSEGGIAQEARRRGVRAKIVRLDSSVPSIKSSKIIAHDQDVLSET